IVALDWQGFTTAWYRDAWSNTDLRSAVANSLVVALIVTAISMVLGTMSAFAITRFRFHGRGLVAGLVGAPLVVPWLMIGIGGGYDQTFPVWVYSELRRAPNLPIINASSTLISAVQVLMVIVAWRLLVRDEAGDDRRPARAVIDALP